MSKQLFPHKILWLASYPKSGNTWFRAFLTALLNDGEVDINNMASDGIFSLRDTFDLVTDIDSRDLYDDEAKLMLADVYRHIAAEKNSLSIFKIHDAYGVDREGKNLIPEDVTHCAVYFIRNPLDIAGSLANHMQNSVEDAVNMLNNSNAYMVEQAGNLNKHMQFRQHLSDWSNHVNSWTLKPSFPVSVIRYEDMLTNAFETFSKVLSAIGWHYTDEQIVKAINATNFETLSKQESQKGFKEKTGNTTKFFRTGTIENWKDELSEEQVNKIISKHRKLLEKYKYLVKNKIEKKDIY